MEEMNPEELLSAYLDGEVTDEQRAQVEKLIASDADARATLEELRALSEGLKSLPRMSVGEDLSQRVLRRAERAILERQESASPVASQPESATNSSERNSKTESAEKESISVAASTATKREAAWDGSQGAGWMRRLAWPLLAVAAALLVMVYNRQQQPPNLALAPATAPEAAWEAGPESRVESEESVASKDGPDLADQHAAIRDEGRQTLGTGVNSDAGVTSPPVAPEDSFKKRERSSATFSESELAIQQDKAPKRFSKSAEQDMLADASNGYRANGGSALDRTATANRALAKRGQVAEAEQTAPIVTDGLADIARSIDDQGTLEKNANGMVPQPEMVVELVLTEEALRTNAFDQLLARQNIVFDTSENLLASASDANHRDGKEAGEGGGAAQRDSAKDEAQRGFGDPLAARKNSAPAPPDEPAAEEVSDAEASAVVGKLGNAAPSNDPAKLKELPLPGEPAAADKFAGVKAAEDRAASELESKSSKRRGLGPQEDRRTAQENAEHETVELIYVVASASQIQAAIADLQARSEDYPAYSIESEPSADRWVQSAIVDNLRAREKSLDGTSTTRSFAGKKGSTASEADPLLSGAVKQEALGVQGEALAQGKPKAASASRDQDEANAPPAPNVSPEPAGRGEQPSELQERQQSLVPQPSSRETAHNEVPQSGRARRFQVPAEELSEWRGKIATDNRKSGSSLRDAQSQNALAESAKEGSYFLESDPKLQQQAGGETAEKSPPQEKQKAEKEFAAQPGVAKSKLEPAAPPAENTLGREDAQQTEQAGDSIAPNQPQLPPTVQKQLSGKLDSDDRPIQQGQPLGVTADPAEQLIRVLFVVRGTRANLAGSAAGQQAPQAEAAATGEAPAAKPDASESKPE